MVRKSIRGQNAPTIGQEIRVYVGSFRNKEQKGFLRLSINSIVAIIIITELRKYKQPGEGDLHTISKDYEIRFPLYTQSKEHGNHK